MGGGAGGGSSRRPQLTHGATKLMYAAQQGDLHTVRKIVRFQPQAVSERDRTGKTPLHYACSANKTPQKVVEYVIMSAEGEDLIDVADEDGFTPLHLAVISGNLPLVNFLLAEGADLHKVDNEDHTVIHWATVCGELHVLQALLAAGGPASTPDVHGGYPLHYAAQMCGGGEKQDEANGLEVLDVLLNDRSVSVAVSDVDGRQPLLWAASGGSAKAVLRLCGAGALVNATDKDGLTALHCAASRGHTECLDTLLTLCSARLDALDANGCSALHYAVTLGHADACALLLERGADPDRQDRKGRTPAHCGCAKGQFETVKLLSKHGAHLWLRNAKGDLPLHEAVGAGRRELVQWLLSMRPNQVNARNRDGRCCLHLAALNDNTDMCKILIDAGAQINPVMRTSKNLFMTPIDCALHKGHRSTAKYLQVVGGIPAIRLANTPKHMEEAEPVTPTKKKTALKRKKSQSVKKTTPPSGILDYSNEIVINGRTELSIREVREIGVSPTKGEEPIVGSPEKNVAFEENVPIEQPSEEAPPTTNEEDHAPSVQTPPPTIEVEKPASPPIPQLESVPNDSGTHLNVEKRQKRHKSTPVPKTTDTKHQSFTVLEAGSNRSVSEERKKTTKMTKKSRKITTRASAPNLASGASSDSETEPAIEPTVPGVSRNGTKARKSKWYRNTERSVNMESVTQSIQGNIRRYHLERKIFQQLLDLKRLQIRSGRHNEAVLVKRAIDAYHESCGSTVGAGRYVPPDYTFKSFETFLYHALRALQDKGTCTEAILRSMPQDCDDIPAVQCTKSSHRCAHAVHAYTGVPCAAYLPKINHHTIPKIGFQNDVECKPGSRSCVTLPNISNNRNKGGGGRKGDKGVTVEVRQGDEKQVISLPTENLAQNKRLYVTFTMRDENQGASPKGHIHPCSD